MLRYCLFHSYQFKLLSLSSIDINICTETYNYATADYHSYSVNQAMHTVSARPCGAVRAHALQCAPMRLLVQPVGSGRWWLQSNRTESYLTRSTKLLWSNFTNPNPHNYRPSRHCYGHPNLRCENTGLPHFSTLVPVENLE